MQSCDQKKLSEFEVAQLADPPDGRLATRRVVVVAQWRLSPRPFAMGRSTKAPPEEKMPGTRTSVVRGARQNPRRRAGGDRSGIAAAWVCVD